MFDISIPWSAILLMAPILMPFLSIPGALFAGLVWYRRKRSFYTALLAALIGAFALPWALLLLALLPQGLRDLTPLSQGALAFLALLAIVGLVLWGTSHAGSRRR
jgi:hypothetical protein